jgi:hypothetical protein
MICLERNRKYVAIVGWVIFTAFSASLAKEIDHGSLARAISWIGGYGTAFMISKI